MRGPAKIAQQIGKIQFHRGLQPDDKSTRVAPKEYCHSVSIVRLTTGMKQASPE